MSCWFDTTALTMGAGGGCLDVFAPVYHFSSFSFSQRRPDIDWITYSRAVRPKNNQQNVASLATFLTTQYATLEFVKQTLHDVREK